MTTKAPGEDEIVDLRDRGRPDRAVPHAAVDAIAFTETFTNELLDAMAEMPRDGTLH
jgi:hypothetical protein